MRQQRDLQRTRYHHLKYQWCGQETAVLSVKTGLPIRQHGIFSAESSIRRASSRQEADALIKSIPDIPLIPLADEKTLEKTYKEYMHEGSCESWVKLLKTIYLRKQSRILKGSKVTALDSRYFKQVEDFLYGELSVALGISRDQVRDYISETIHP